MSSTRAPPPDRPDMLHRLPDELLIGILEQAPSLSALWSLANSSGRLAAVFRCYGAQITEAVLRSTLPPPTQGLVRAVLQLRAGARRPASLAEAREAPALRPGPAPLLPAGGAATPDVVRGAVRLAHRVHVLAHECIRHYIRHCTRMRADELADPALVAAGVGAHQTLGWKRPAGRPQRLPDTGLPWVVEEQLVALNLWRLQYYLEVRAALAAGRLAWPADDRAAVQTLCAPRFYRLEVKSYRREQLEAVVRYVAAAWKQQHGDGDMAALPRPTTTQPFHRPCAPSARLAARLEFKPRGWDFVTGIPGTPGDTNYSPLYGVTLGAYRKYGFAVFHDKRMVDLGLLPP